jgi:hypothetical protein
MVGDTEAWNCGTQKGRGGENRECAHQAMTPGSRGALRMIVLKRDYRLNELFVKGK